MPLTDDVRTKLVRDRAMLTRRFGNTADETEKRRIKSAIGKINLEIRKLDLADLLGAAQVIADSIDILEQVVKSVRTGPFDGFLGDIEMAIRQSHELSGRAHGLERLPPAIDPAGSAVAETPKAPAPALEPPVNSRQFTELEDEYAAYYALLTARPEFQNNIDYYLGRLDKYKAIYRSVGDALNGIPWALVGAIHAMEAGFNFYGHLHNGDPLTGRTVHEPAGRPLVGAPPFTWRQSAEDALTQKGLHQIDDWSLSQMLYQLERYNGFGYRDRRLPTPYLWSFSNLYDKGKFVADGQFDPNATSKQCGAAVMLKALEQEGGDLRG